MSRLGNINIFGLSSKSGSSSGGGGGVPLNYIEVTYAAMATLISSNGLKKGSFYKITDRGDLGIFVQALSVNQITTIGQRIMLCPATYVTGLDTYGNNWIGVWNISKTVTVNYLTIWGGEVWKNKTGSIGTARSDVLLDATNWGLIPKTAFTNNQYISLVFNVEYDFINDWIYEQSDGYGNVFGLDKAAWTSLYGLPYNPCDISDWNLNTLANGYFYANTCYGLYNNAVPNAHIYSNSCIGLIKDNNNLVTEISKNSNKGGIYGNKTTGAITRNSNIGTIYNNANTGDMFNNCNSGDIYNNMCTLLQNNNNNGQIASNKNTGVLTGNSNNGTIDGNTAQVAFIVNNSNNGDISTNSIIGNIEGNINNGFISLNTSSVGVDILYNTNNGYIGDPFLIVTRTTSILGVIVNI